MLLISTKTGKLLNISIVPDRMESYYSPQLLKRSAKEEYILIGTGGETHGGALYALNLKCFTEYCATPVPIKDFVKSAIMFLLFSTLKSSAIGLKV